MQQFYAQVQSTYDVPEFNIAVKHCGFSNAYSDPNITLCMELIEELNSKGLTEAVAFVLSHELSHSLLKLWGYPLYDNEDVADELGTTMILMSQNYNQNIIMNAVQWWASSPYQEQEAMSKVWVNDRHTVSPQRARNIISWLNNSPELLTRWQKILVPKMQTGELAAWDKRIDLWIDHRLIKEELARRNQPSSTSELLPAQ